MGRPELASGAQGGAGAGPVASDGTVPAASIIVPAHNEEQSIGRCLESLSRQTLCAGCEVIVVDDGSTDRTAQIAREHGATVIAHARRCGAAAARNTGAGQARGAILVFIDADCEASPQWLETMLAPFGDPGISAVYGAYRSRQAGRIARFAQAEFDERYARLARHEGIDFFATHAAAVRRPVLAALGGFHPDLWGNEDVELAFRLAQQGGRIVFAPEAVVYHEHPATLARYLRTKVSRGYWRTVVYARYPHKAVSDTYTPAWLKAQVAGLAVVGLALALTACRPQFLSLLLLVGAGLLATTIPFTWFLRRAHPELVVITPWLSLARSGALALGALAGLAVAALERGQRITRGRSSKR